MFLQRLAYPIYLLGILFVQAFGQCPWHQDIAELQASCLCAYNLGQELSVQCDQVSAFIFLYMCYQLWTSRFSLLKRIQKYCYFEIRSEQPPPCRYSAIPLGGGGHGERNKQIMIFLDARLHMLSITDIAEGFRRFKQSF